ncbi:hypothetical protein FHS79_003733 [Polymorphobacter multimanifer]|uniref:Uncharacterized protein n=2 Tax=Polymorphobacter multimanifer TaxID=1070431 RepID=A0A841LAR8_9SPHN|nr:hypothetical protein [Polymorphobacter multimanifer]
MTGGTIFAGPHGFYDRTPGLAMIGPYSMHFIRDVGLAFVAGGATLAIGAWLRNRSLALAGTAWPVLHALFHIQIWAHRGLAFDAIAGLCTAVTNQAIGSSAACR